MLVVVMTTKAALSDVDVAWLSDDDTKELDWIEEWDEEIERIVVFDINEDIIGLELEEGVMAVNIEDNWGETIVEEVGRYKDDPIVKRRDIEEPVAMEEGKGGDIVDINVDKVVGNGSVVDVIGGGGSSAHFVSDVDTVVVCRHADRPLSYSFGLNIVKLLLVPR